MRLHLFEFNDQPWLPQFIRDALTGFLTAAYRATPLGGLFASRIATLLGDSGSNKIVDLCSGAGGPIQLVEHALRRQGIHPEITMTDLFPNEQLCGAGYWPQPVDARSVPPELVGMRTMFASFHHFRPAEAARILKDSRSKQCAIGIFEATARTPAGIAGAIFVIPVLAFFLVPKIRPMKLSQILLTFVLPVLPLMIAWDGLVSQLRTYTPPELDRMTLDLSGPGYQWESGTIQVPGTPLWVPYLTGRPVSQRFGRLSS